MVRKRAKNTKSYNYIVILVVAAIVLFAIVFVWINVFGGFNTSRTYYAPDLRGMTVEEATNYIRNTKNYSAHFTIETSDEIIENSSYSTGTIAEQTPEPGTATKSTMTKITVSISGEAESDDIYMPNIVGEDYETWISVLNNDYGLTVTYSMQASDNYNEGKIIATDPEAGTVLDENQTVKLYVSNGKLETSGEQDDNEDNGAGLEMISVVGMSENTAKVALETAGFTVGTVTTVESSETEGTVVSQSVEEGASVAEGTAVDIEVSSGYVNSTTNHDSDSDDDVTDEDVAEEVYYANGEHDLTITMPKNRTSSSLLTVTVNGMELFSESIGADKATVKLTISGTITSLLVTIDGESYSNYLVESF